MTKLSGINFHKLAGFILFQNIRTPLANPISTSNSFELLSENLENILEANHASTTETNTVKDSKTNNANTSDENKKSAFHFVWHMWNILNIPRG